MTTLSATRIRAARTLIANYLDVTAEALDHIRDELAYTTAEVLPAATIDGGSHGSGTNSPVERHVIDARTRLNDTHDDLWEFYNSILLMADRGLAAARAVNQRHVPGHDHKRCNAGANMQLEGWMVWRHRDPLTLIDGTVVHRDADCPNWPGDNPVIDGLCDKCLGRMNQWRITNDLPIVARDVHAMTYRNVRNGTGGRFERAS